MTDKPNMDISFEGVNVILKLTKTEKDVPGKIAAFKELSFGTLKFKKLVHVEGYTPKLLDDYWKAWEAAHYTPETRRIIKLEADVDLLQKAHNALADLVNKIGASLTAKKSSRKSTEHLKHNRMRNWYDRIARGEEKAVKIAAILEAAGIQVTPLASMAQPFYNLKQNETRSVAELEEIFDAHGEDGLRAVILTVVQLEPENLRLIYIRAVNYAINVSPEKLPPDAVFAQALDYFHTMSFSSLMEMLGTTYADEPSPNYLTLGKLITGELKPR